MKPGEWICGLILLLLFASDATASPLAAHPAQSADRAGYADGASCMGCHVEQAQAWKDSDHAWAMRTAKPEHVLGDFSDATFEDAGVEARFFMRNERYFVNTEGPDGKPADFEVIYTFGHDPLQQYLVALDGGRLQALTIAWDSRPKSEGGQRWFSLYPGQRFAPQDALHWTGRYQNWNAMCADCHSTGLHKHYDLQTDRYATTWQEQTVGCQGCHGPGQAHVAWARENAAGKTPKGDAHYRLTVDFAALGAEGLIEQCAFCHSRRQGLGTGQRHGHPLLDSSLPVTLRADLYHPDGQVDGEVYVYGSFMQSRMHAAGVTCSDCHDVHSLETVADGNALCQSCHNPQPPARFPSLAAKRYDSPAHHHHAPGTPGAQCVACHMPSKTFMQVDARRDHSFRLPRPDLTATTGAPDACTSCHRDRTPAWAAKTIQDWTGRSGHPTHYGELLQAARRGDEPLRALAQVIDDLASPAIVRATAADELGRLGPAAQPSLRKALQDEHALVRAYAASAFGQLPRPDRLDALLPLLDDPVLAVRDQAARALAEVPVDSVPASARETLRDRMTDYRARLEQHADLPGGRLNLAVLLERQGQRREAIKHYRAALGMDPYFTPARVNLVTLVSTTGRHQETEQLLREGLALPDMPGADHGQLAYLLALHLIERGQPDEGLRWLSEAAQRQPQNARIRYNQGLLLMQMQRPNEAREALQAGLRQAPGDADLLFALIYLHGTQGQRSEALNYLHLLEQAHPSDHRVAQLRRQLGGAQ